MLPSCGPDAAVQASSTSLAGPSPRMVQGHHRSTEKGGAGRACNTYHRPLHQPGATQVAHLEQRGLFAVLGQFVIGRRLQEGCRPHEGAQEQGQRGHVVLVQELPVGIVVNPCLDQRVMVEVQQLRSASGAGSKDMVKKYATSSATRPCPHKLEVEDTAGLVGMKEMVASVKIPMDHGLGRQACCLGRVLRPGGK